MASHWTNSPSANIVWDKSRLHPERTSLPNGHALVPSSGQVTPRAVSSGTATPRPLSSGAVTPRPLSSGAANPRPNSSGANVRRTNGLITVTKALKHMPESDLVTSFDPLQDLHLWTMWRVAVNGRIVDETRRRSRTNPSSGFAEVDANPFGRALIKTPLDRFIRVEDGSEDIAGVMMDPHGEGGGHLGTRQFVFYGVPRVVLKKPKQVKQLP